MDQNSSVRHIKSRSDSLAACNSDAWPTAVDDQSLVVC